MTDENGQGREILLDNKKLLSIFFLVAVMMGVSFTVGFMLGRNTGTVSASTNGTTVAGSGMAAARAGDTPASPPPSDPAPVARTEANPPVVDRPTGTQPAKPYEKPPTSSAAGQASVVDAPAPPAHVSPSAGGSYLQVAALKRQDADSLVASLQKRGYPAMLGESPKEGLFRVLVGPFHDMASLAESKQKLRASGFDNTIIAR